MDGSLGVPTRDARAENDAAPMRDADVPSIDGPRDSAADVLVSPDCTCPPLDFFLDATMGTTPMHLTAPYGLNIYCAETAVQLAHPACGQVYRLSACKGPNYAPPCFYMGFDLSRGLLLGHFIDDAGQSWDVVNGAIAPEPPMGRVGTGTFTATLRPHGGGDTVLMSGSFRACMPLFPACET